MVDVKTVDHDRFKNFTESDWENAVARLVADIFTVLDVPVGPGVRALRKVANLAEQRAALRASLQNEPKADEPTPFLAPEPKLAA